ncbi:MAG: beta-ketoacyl-[acyl-carrier-protein] synthase family protein [Candidatus Binatia bacterium]
MTGRRAAITGIGIIGPTGVGHAPFWEAVCAARPALRRLRRFDASLTPCEVAGEVDDEWLAERIETRKRRTTTRATQLALVAAELATADARLPRGAVAPEAFGVMVGTALGGWCDAEQQAAILLERGARRVNPFVTSGAPNHGPGVEVAAVVGAQGPQFTFSTGCPAGLQALAQGAALIESGIADACLVGGTDAPLSPVAFAALTRTNELSTCPDPLRACRPFDDGHAGMILSEGGAFLLLEEAARARARGAAIYATLLGSAFSCDAQGLYGADESGAAAAHAVQRLLATTATRADQIDYICAHANSSSFFDRKEITVLSAALGECLPSIPVSSIKGVLGHPFGASGAFQTAAAALAIRDGVIPPTANLESPAAECRARHVIGEPIAASLRRILVTSYGYGGVNGFLLVGAPEA